MRLVLPFLLVLAAWLAPASAADIKLLTAGAFKPAAQEIVPIFEKKTGHKVTIETGTAGALARRVAAGEYFDIVVMPPLNMGPLLGGRLVEGSAKALARAGVGVAVKQGATVPDISGTDSFRDTILAARRVAYVDPASGGSSGVYLTQLWDQLGITAQVKAKALLVQGGLVAEKVASGEADLGLQQSSELMAVPGVTFVGPLPLELQNYTLYSGALSAGSGNRAAAGALLLELADPENLKLIRKVGLDEP